MPLHRVVAHFILAVFVGATASSSVVAGSQVATTDRTTESEVLPTGMSITPTASPKSVFYSLNPDLPDLPQYTVDHPVSMAVSPDGAKLLILTSGYNINND